MSTPRRIHLKAALLLMLSSFFATARAQSSLDEGYGALRVLLSHAVMVLKARQIGPIDDQKSAAISFEILENWKSDPKMWSNKTPKGFPTSRQDEHNFHIAKGRDYILVYDLTPEGVGGTPRLIRIFQVAGRVVIGLGLAGAAKISVEGFKKLAESSNWPIGFRF